MSNTLKSSLCQVTSPIKKKNSRFLRKPQTLLRNWFWPSGVSPNSAMRTWAHWNMTSGSSVLLWNMNFWVLLWNLEFLLSLGNCLDLLCSESFSSTLFDRLWSFMFRFAVNLGIRTAILVKSSFWSNVPFGRSCDGLCVITFDWLAVSWTHWHIPLGLIEPNAGEKSSLRFQRIKKSPDFWREALSVNCMKIWCVRNFCGTFLKTSGERERKQKLQVTKNSRICRNLK